MGIGPLAFAVLQGVSSGTAPPDTVLPPADSVALATAYLDDGARELVRLARTHRDVMDASVFRYTALGRQRVSAGIQAFRRDRLLFRRETASRLEWRRDGPSRVEVVGAREVIPVARAGIQVPADLDQWARSFMPRPGDHRLFVNPTGGGFAWHPLVEGAEALYRYASGDTTVIRLPDGRAIRLAELRVIPRVPDVRVVSGSFWIERDGHAIVQAVFRPAREFDLERDLRTLDPDDPDDMDDVPALLRPIRFDVRFVAVSYGLWEMLWWMPRLMAFEGHLQVGALRMPLSLELTYDEYVVEADRHGLPELPPLTLGLAGDTANPPRTHEFPVRVVMADTATLLSSPHLPPSIYGTGERLMSQLEMRELADRVGALPTRPWAAPTLSLAMPWQMGAGLMRYNRVEGLSLGVRGEVDLGRLTADATARLGLAELEPGVELGATMPTLHRRWRLAAYHRLATADPATRPFGLRNSLGALVLGQDDGVYFRATGAELELTPGSGGLRHEARLYVERQRPSPARTDFSLRRAIGGDHTFGPELLADRADQVGLALRTGVHGGLDPAGFRWGGWLDVTAEAGTFTFLRPGVTLLAGAPLPGGLVASLEVGAGTTLAASEEGPGTPAQAAWFLGGAQTLRGFQGGAFHGPDHGRLRLELANALPAARLVVFSDLGWAGTFDEYRSQDLAVSAGVGAAFLDGLVRVDLARALRPWTGWRLVLATDLIF